MNNPLVCMKNFIKLYLLLDDVGKGNDRAYGIVFVT